MLVVPLFLFLVYIDIQHVLPRLVASIMADILAAGLRTDTPLGVALTLLVAFAATWFVFTLTIRLARALDRWLSGFGA